MDKKTKVLSVDDNAQNRKVIELGLKDHFDVVSTDGNEPFIDLVIKEQPKIILLDIMLEGKSGFDLCKELKDTYDHDDIIIIFVSALTTVKDKLIAYANGGDDYICKPVDLVELNQKLKGVEKRIIEKEQLASQCSQASQVAFTSMKNASELGSLITFFTDSINISTLDELFQKISEFFTEFDLNFSLEFRVNNKTYIYPISIDSSLEREVLQLGSSAKRILTVGRNILFNSQWCSILIKCIPENDEALVGRIRDHIAILLSIIDSRLMFIDSEQKRTNERAMALESLSSSLSDNFSEIKKEIQTQEQDLLRLFSELIVKMSTKSISMGLSEDQESELVGLFEETKDQFYYAMNSAVSIDGKLRNINRLLENVH